MRITKKAVSIILAIMMVASMMAVMAVTASAATVITTAAELDTLVAGNTYVLGADIDYSEIYTVRNARDLGSGHSVDLKDCTLDLNGHTISTINATVTFAGNGATIKNGTFDLVHKNTDGSFKYGSYAIIIDNKVAGYPASAKVTVTDVVCGGAVNVCGATVELNNVTATTTGSKFYTVWAEQNANVIINSGKYTDNQSGGKGIFNTGKGEEGGAVIDVNGGTFETTNKVVYSAENNDSINIAGGIFNKEVPAVYLDEGLDTITVDGKKVVVTQGTDPASVAIVGTTGYTTLQAALTAAPSGSTVTLLSDITATTTDIEINKNLTIDFGTYTYTAARWPFINNATLTLNGTTGGVSSSRGIVDNYGTLIINGGVYNEANVRTPAIWNNPNSELVVNGGTINSTHATIYSENGAVTTINDGVLNSTSSSKTDGVNYSYAVRCLAGSTTTVNGGTITGVHGGIVAVGDGGNTTTLVINDATITTHNSELGNDAFYPIYVSGNNTSVTVKDGTFSGPRAAAMLDDNDIGLTENTSLVIEGGTFTSPANVQAVSRGQNDSYPGVSGGTFSSAVPTEYCAEDYYPVSNGGSYTVDSITAPTISAITLAENAFGFDASFNNGRLLGVQMKNHVADAATTSASGQEDGENDIRFVTAIETELLNAAEDYGFVLAKVDAANKDKTNTAFENLKANWGNGEKTVSAKDTKNNINGKAYGDPSDTSTNYKFVTCAVNAVESGKKIVARFYVKVNGKVYYMNYVDESNASYGGCIAGVNNGSIY